MKKILSIEQETFKTQIDQLLWRAEGKYVLIKKNRVIGVYESKLDAISEGYNRFGNVPFLVKEVTRFDIF